MVSMQAHLTEQLGTGIRLCISSVKGLLGPENTSSTPSCPFILVAALLPLLTGVARVAGVLQKSTEVMTTINSVSSMDMLGCALVPDSE